MGGVQRILGGISVAILAFSSISCSWHKKEENLDLGEGVKVQIPVSENGRYRLSVVTLKTLKDLTQLEGDSAQFLIDPSGANGSLRGRPPEIRYMRDNEDVIVARDEMSLQLLTMYAHLEQLHNLDILAGASGVLQYPRVVGVNANVRSDDGKMEDNVVYSGAFDSILVMSYRQDALPLMANAGVIGHEHFHALFQKLVVEPLGETYPDPSQPSIHHTGSMSFERAWQQLGPISPQDMHRIYHAVFLRAVNEGFADVWGWVYSGDRNFVGRSLPSQKIARDLEMPAGDVFFTKAALVAEIQKEFGQQYLIGLSYRYGTQLARALRNFATLYAKQKSITVDEVRPLIGQILVKSLAALQTTYAAMADDQYLTLSQVASMFVNQVPGLGSKACFDLAKMVPADERGIISLGEKKCRSIETKEIEEKEKKEKSEEKDKRP